MVGEGRDVEVAPHEIRGVAILRAGFKFFTDHELEKADFVVFHAVNINETPGVMQEKSVEVSEKLKTGKPEVFCGDGAAFLDEFLIEKCR